MSGFSNYEADQSALYSGGHHQDSNSKESKGLVKKIWKVTGILSVITIIEVGLGLWCYSNPAIPKGVVNALFVGLTILKAAYIVRVFMHLGDEVKNMISSILIPLFLFVWFIIAFLADGDFWLSMNKFFR
jgi:cytochrome c oxidase subunit IV